MVVRAPTGMESDLSRPVIEIRRFPSGELTHEMFAFGSEIAVVPVSGEDGGASPAMIMAADELKRQVIRHTGISVAHAKFLTESSAEIYVDQSAVGAVVGPGGENIRRLERQIGVKLDVKSVRELPRNQRKRIDEGSTRTTMKMNGSRDLGAIGLETIVVGVRRREGEEAGRAVVRRSRHLGFH